MKRANPIATPAVLWLLLATLCGSAHAADSPSKLRSEMTRAEREYIDLYNKVNTDPQFAIVCRTETQTGSNFSTRVCRPRYLMQASERAATEHMQAATAAGVSSGAANSNGPNVGAVSGGGASDLAQGKDEAFRQNMLAALQKSPELQALGKKRDELQARYDEATKGKAKDGR
jgi:hypothetical protein